MLRSFREDPATITLGALWIVVFALMAYDQGGLPGGSSVLTGMILPQTAHGYGSLTVRDVVAGQVWRTLTASFIHFNLLHLGVNLFGLYQLGRVLESWYGSPQFLGVYVFIAGLGNGLAVGAKLALGTWFPRVAAFQDIPSGGGSTVLLGLIALLAVVGGRSGTRHGSHVKAQMIGILLFTAILGAAIPVFDNFGHAGGAIAGALVGLRHRALLRNYEGRRLARKLIGGGAAVLLLAAGTTQAWELANGRATASGSSPREAATQQLQADLRALQHLAEAALLYHQVIQRHPGDWRHVDPRAIDPIRGTPAIPDAGALSHRFLAALAAIEADQAHLHDATPNFEPCRVRLQELGRKALRARPTPGEIVSFRRCLERLMSQSGSDLVRQQAILKSLGATPAR